MAKYCWSIHDIEKKQDFIEQLYKNTNDTLKRELYFDDILYINDILKENEQGWQGNDDLNENSLINKFNLCKKDLNKCIYLWDDFKKFYYTIPEPLDYIMPDTIQLTETELLDITHDFYKTLNPYFYNLFLKNFKLRNDHLSFGNIDDDSLGITQSLNSIQESYIKVTLSHTIDDISVLIHEYAHATSALINPYQTRATKTLYSETESLLFELLGLDYLENIFDKDEVNNLKRLKFNDWWHASKRFTNIINLINLEKNLKNGFNTKSKLISQAYHKLNLDIEDLNKYLKKSCLCYKNYLTSFMIAIELYNMYKNDPEYALNKLDEIIKLTFSNPESYYTSISDMNIIFNEHLLDYYETLKPKVLKKTKPTK